MAKVQLLCSTAAKFCKWIYLHMNILAHEHNYGNMNFSSRLKMHSFLLFKCLKWNLCIFKQTQQTFWYFHIFKSLKDRRLIINKNLITVVMEQLIKRIKKIKRFWLQFNTLVCWITIFLITNIKSAMTSTILHFKMACLKYFRTASPL